VLVAGGFKGGGSRDTYLFDPTPGQDKFLELTVDKDKLPSRRYGAEARVLPAGACASICDKAMVAGGQASDDDSHQTWLFSDV